MLLDYQREEFETLAKKAKHALKSDCPLVEDETISAVAEHLQQLEEFVEYIARDWVELSHEKVLAQRNDYIQKARKLREQFNVSPENFNDED